VRTVLSILPTLSREYDLYFKSFSNVPVTAPVNKSKLAAAEKGAVNGEKKKEEENKKKRENRKSTSAAGTGSQGEEEDDEEEEEEEDGEEDEEDSGADEAQQVAPAGVEGEGGDEPAAESAPPTDDWRGSR
jgi:hypothetical protein